MVDSGLPGVSVANADFEGFEGADVDTVSALSVGGAEADVDGDAWSFLRPRQLLKASSPPASGAAISVRWRGARIVTAGTGATSHALVSARSVGSADDAETLAEALLDASNRPDERIRLRIVPTLPNRPTIGQTVRLESALLDKLGARHPIDATGELWIVESQRLTVRGGSDLAHVEIECVRGAHLDLVRAWWSRLTQAAAR